MQEQTVLVIGCGKLGRRVAEQLAKDGYAVHTCSRSEKGSLEQIPHICADVTRPETLTGLGSKPWSYVLYCLSASERTDQSYYEVYVRGVEHVLNAMTMRSIRRFFFVSSTSVYHQDDHSVVDELSLTQPETFSGKRMLEAEQVVANAECPTTVIRFSGIYGGQRTQLREQVRTGMLGLSQSVRLTNRIHEDDCVAVLVHLLQRSRRDEALESLYLASDSCPVDLNEVVRFIAAQEGLPCPENAPPGRRRAGNKRCSNQRLIATGYNFKYPSYREGYAQKAFS